MKKRILSILLALCMLAGIIPLNAVTICAEDKLASWGDVADTSWYTKTASTYHISTPEQLAGLAYLVNCRNTEFLNETIYLDSDINLAGKEWIPIDWGGWVDQRRGCPGFRGILDGQGHTISNMTITSIKAGEKAGTSPVNSNEYYTELGLFGRLDGILINLKMENASIKLSENDAKKTTEIGFICGTLCTDSPRSENVTKSGIISCSVTASTIGAIGAASAAVFASAVLDGSEITNCTSSNNTIVSKDETQWSSYADEDFIASYDTTSNFVIYTPEELAAVSKLSMQGKNFSGKTLTLAKDLDMSAKTWTPIMEFNGTIKGNSHTIYGLNSKPIIIANISHNGFIATTNSGCNIEKLTILINTKDSPTTSESRYGGLIASSAGAVTLNGCKVFGTVGGQKVTYAGGLLGFINSGAVSTIQECVNKATVRAFTGYTDRPSNTTGVAGGIVGQTSKGTMHVKGCINNGAISSDSDAGGIVAKSNETQMYISETNNTSAVYGRYRASGIIGYSLGTLDIINSNNTGEIGKNFTPFVYNVQNSSYSGGIVGYAQQITTLKNCCNTASINGYSSTGGLVGGLHYNIGTITIASSSNTGKITTTTDGGGLVGLINDKIVGSITNSVSAASVFAEDLAGGLIGQIYSSNVIIESCGVLQTDVSTNQPLCISTTKQNGCSGGLVGMIDNSRETSTVTINNSYCTAQVKTDGQNAFCSGLFNMDVFINKVPGTVNVNTSYFGGTLTYSGTDSPPNHMFLCYGADPNYDYSVSCTDVYLLAHFYADANGDNKSEDLRNYTSISASNKSFAKSDYYWFAVHNEWVNPASGLNGNSKFKFKSGLIYSEKDFVSVMNKASGQTIWAANNTIGNAYQYGMPYISTNADYSSLKNKKADIEKALSSEINSTITFSNVAISGDANSDLSTLNYEQFSKLYSKLDGSQENPWTVANTATGLTIRIETVNPTADERIDFSSQLFNKGDVLSLRIVNSSRTDYIDDEPYTYTTLGTEGDRAGSPIPYIHLSSFKNSRGEAFPAGLAGSRTLYITVKYGDISNSLKQSTGECYFRYRTNAMWSAQNVTLNNCDFTIKKGNFTNGDLTIDNNDVVSEYNGNSKLNIPVSITPKIGYELKKLSFTSGDKTISPKFLSNGAILQWDAPGVWEVNASFEKVKYSLELDNQNVSLLDTNNNAVSASDIEIEHGSDYSFKLKANDGYILSDVTINNSKNFTVLNDVYTVKNVQDAVRIVATTTKKTDTSITLSVNQTATPRKLSFRISGLPADATGGCSLYSDNNLIGSANVGDTMEIDFAPGKTTFSFTVQYTGDSKYNGCTSQAVVFSMEKSNQSQLSFANNKTAYTYGDDAFSMEASGGSGTGKLTYASSNPSVATVDENGKVTLVGTGTFTITATKAGDDNYNEAVATTSTITVSQKKVTISGVAVKDKVYDGKTDATISSDGTLNGVVSGDTVNVTAGSCTFNSVNAADSVALTVSGFAISGADAAKYELSAQPTVANAKIEKATLTVSVDDVTIYKGQAIPALNVSISGFVNGESAETLNGFELPTASVSGTVDTTDSAVTSFTVAYSGGNATNNYKFDLSNTTAKIMIKTVEVGDNDFTLSADNTVWQSSELTLSPANEYTQISADGTNWQSSLTLSQEGVNDITFYLKKADGTLTESKTITYKLDKTAPTDVQVQYNQNGWKSFLNTVTFGIFFKENVDVAATAEDALSGIKAIEYYAANSEITDFSSIAWENSLTLTQNSKKIVYVKATDNANNFIICHDGVVVYTDSALATITAEFNHDIQTDIDVEMQLNGNTLDKVKNGETELIKDSDYTLDGNKVTIKKEYLASAITGNSLSLTFSFNPMGESFTGNGSAPLTAEFTVTKHVHTPEADDSDCSTPIKCSWCGFITTAAKQHDFKGEWLSDDSGHWYECQNDGCTQTDTKASHSGGEATCTKKAVCEVCGISYGEINPDNHHLVKTDAKSATHFEVGNIEYYTCKECGKIFSDKDGKKEITLADTVLAVIPHEDSFTAWVSSETEHWHTCSCGELLDKAAHSFAWVADKEATETEKGSKHEECIVCGYKKPAVEAPATDDVSAPPTSDRDNMLLWLALLFVSCGVLTTLGISKKRKKSMK